MNQAVQGLATPSRLIGIPLAVAVHSAVAQMTFAAEEISSMVDTDLEEAVDGIINKAKEEASNKPVIELAAVDVPLVDLATLVDFIPVKGTQGRYRIVSNKLREFIQGSMDTRIIDSNMLECPGDTDALKAARLRISIQPLERFSEYFDQFSEMTEAEVTTSESGLTYAEFCTFFQDFSVRHMAHTGKIEAAKKAKLDGHLKAFASGVVTFDDLEWGLKEEVNGNVTYIFRDGDQHIAGKLTKIRRQETMFGPYLQAIMEVYSRNEVGLNKETHTHIFGYFEEATSLESLNIVRLVSGSDIAKRLIERGTKYLQLTQKPNYVNSKGNMTRKVGRSIEVINAKGRVMVDITGMTNMDPNYYQYFCKADNDEPVIPFNSVAEVSDEVKLACVPYVYGFTFKGKRWGQMNVADMEAIEFRTDAYEMLVLDQDTKDLIFAAVTDNASDNDIISGKGGGSINLLEGPPGVGKTLTAEAVAEKLQKPLYMVSVGELGTNVNELESNLKDILEIAAAWDAVLLIDEADIFLETRDKHDVIRNAMVAVFLRLLEYYPGVMFLTTNRADNLDPAFESRITLCIHFTELDIFARKQVWTNLFKAAKIDVHNAIDVDKLSTHRLNGRQIKGIIKTAGSLARFQNQKLTMGHFEAVIQQKADFKSATVYHMGHGLDDHKVAGEYVAVKKQGFWQRILAALINNGASLGQGK